MEKNPIDLNNPNQSPREQEGLDPNLAEQKPGQPSAFAGMDTGTVVPEGETPRSQDRNTIDPATGGPATDADYVRPTV